MEAGTSAAPKKRRRPPTACEQCRQRKVRCDCKSPCGPCLRIRSDACTYVPLEKPGASARGHRNHGAAYAGGPASPLTPESIPFAQNKVMQASSRADSSLPADRESATSRSEPYSAGETGGTSDVLALSRRVQELEQKLSSVGVETSGSSSFVLPPNQDSVLKGVFAKAKFYGPSHWINFMEQFPVIVDLQQRLESGEYSDIAALFDKCKKLGRAIKAQQPFQPIPADIRDYVPPRETCDILVRAYIRTFEGAYRILHIPSFEREYEQYWIDAQAAHTAFVIKLLLVLAIGSNFHPDPNFQSSHRVSASQWIYTAQSWMSFPFAEKSRLNIAGLQIHCLLLLAREATAVGSDMIWASAGTLLRTAMILGLHRDPSKIPNISAFDAEIRKRLWSTVLEICLQSSIDAGGSPLISFEDFDCGSPSNINDSQINEEKKSTPIAKDDGVFTETTMQLALLKTYPLRLRIAKAINDFRSDLPYEQVIQLGLELSKTYRNIQKHFASLRQEGLRPSAFQVKLFELMTQRFLLVLHQAFALKARTHHVYYFSRKVCSEASYILLSQYVPSFSDTTTEDEIDVQRLQMLGGGMFKNIPVLSSFMICLEIMTRLEEDVPSFGSDSNSIARLELIKRLEEYRNIAGERVRTSDTNIKAYVFASFMLGHIQALENGTSVEEATLTAIRTALKFSYEVLEARAGNATTPLGSNILEENLQAQENLTFIPPFDGTTSWEDLGYLLDINNMQPLF